MSFDEAKQNKRVLLVDFDDENLTSVTDITVPCFQPLAMIKTCLSELSHAVETRLSELDLSPKNNEKLWLDIELVDSDRLSDLQSRIATLVEDFPVEILLVRRAKQIRQQLMEQQQDNSTLSELTLDEVFSSRLSQEAYFSPKGENTNEDDSNESDLETGTEAGIEAEKIDQHKKRLQTLFKQTVTQVLAKGSAQ